MKQTYALLNYLLFLLGIIHCFFTFKKHKTFDLEALWFFSAGAGLIFCSFINYINMTFQHQTIQLITFSSNSIQLTLSIFLTLKAIKTKTIFALVLILLIFIASLSELLHLI